MGFTSVWEYGLFIDYCILLVLSDKLIITKTKHSLLRPFHCTLRLFAIDEFLFLRRYFRCRSRISQFLIDFVFKLSSITLVCHLIVLHKDIVTRLLELSKVRELNSVFWWIVLGRWVAKSVRENKSRHLLLARMSIMHLTALLRYRSFSVTSTV